MKRVTGIGGIFFRSKDKEALGEWYRRHLGVDLQDWGGAVFEWNEEGGRTVWSPFDADTSYFGPNGASFMINYRVEDLDALLAALREEGVWIDDKREDSEFGRFAWIEDCDGNRVELWQPPEGQ